MRDVAEEFETVEKADMSSASPAEARTTVLAAPEPVVHRDGTFKFFAPMYVFEKADAPEGKRRRIGGIITTDTEDREEETMLQDNIDFSPWLKDGFFNDNHMKGIAGIIGEPDPSALRYFRKGERLANGQIAKANGHWAEGWLYENDPRATEIWNKAQAMQKSPTGRRLGFSVEGAILKRTGANKKTIAKARVLHVAATHCPVNPDTTLDVLAKSLAAACLECTLDDAAAEAQAKEALGAAAPAAEATNIDGIIDMDLSDRPCVCRSGATGSAAAKALSMGPPTSARPSGPVSGAGAGRTLAVQSLEHDELKRDGVRPLEKGGDASTLSLDQAFSLVRMRYPNISCAAAGRIVDLTLSLKRRGRGGLYE